MATKYSVGHAMRRRMGLSSHPLGEVGSSMARNHVTHEEAYEAAASVGSPRIPVSGAPALEGTLVPRQNVQAGDPTAGGKANRVNIERVGAQYHISVPFTPTIDPAAGPTMRNARIIPSIQGRVTPNFENGIQTAGL